MAFQYLPTLFRNRQFIFTPMRTKSTEHIAAIEAMTLFYIAVGEIATKNLTLDRKLEKTVLIISTLTSGALWTLIATQFENAAAWVGAIFTTIATGITIYQSSIGPNKTNVLAQSLYEEIGEYLAGLASAVDFDSFEFRDTARKFEAKLRKIETNHPILFTGGVMLGSINKDRNSTEEFLKRMRMAINHKTRK